MNPIEALAEVIDRRKQNAALKEELANLRSYVDKMDGIAEQIVDWGNECASCAAHYKEISMRLKEHCDELEAQLGSVGEKEVIESWVSSQDSSSER